MSAFGKCCLASVAIGLLAGVSGQAGEPPPEQLVRRVADAVLRDFPDPPAFNWGEGVLMAGMMRAHRLTGDQRYLDFVRRFADHWRRQGIEELLSQRGYCGHWGPGWAMLMLHEETGKESYRRLAEQIVDFMMHRAERSRDGGLSHFSGQVQLWVDTLAMCCPVLSHAARLSGRAELQQEAVRQLDVFARHLQDAEAGLFYHMWDQTTGRRTAEFWGRGNGWVVLSYVEVLKHERPDSAAGRRLAAAFEKQLSGIVRFQDSATGLWHTILDDPQTYLETSASAMFLYGLAEGRHHGLLSGSYDQAMHGAYRGLCPMVDLHGRVVGVSEGTGPRGRAHYATRKQGTYTWGTGALLLGMSAYKEYLTRP